MPLPLVSFISVKHVGKESTVMDGFCFKFNFLAEIKHIDMRVYTGKNCGTGTKIHHDVFVHANIPQASHLHSLTKTMALISD